MPTGALADDAQRAMATTGEGYCPLCQVALIIHDDRACCPCGGCSYRVDGDRLEMLSSCDLHPAHNCVHWETVWEARKKTRPSR